MKIEERLSELKSKIEELDYLISDTLDNEPESENGTYGNMIKELFNDTSWLDVSIFKIE